ncbi:MAG: hypothetical protein OXH49_12265 [Gemmatimonadetes bacterium]|nr:hypothetical protein [Gemmatimonadota bacterium]
MKRFPLLTLLAVLAVQACDTTSPATFEEPSQTRFEEFKELTSTPLTDADLPAVAKKLNRLLGRDPDSPVRFVSSVSFGSRSLHVTNVDGSTETPWMTTAASAASDVVCSVDSGDSTEEWDEFIECANDNPGCDVNVRTSPIRWYGHD